MGKILWGIVILVVVLLGGMYFISGNGTGSVVNEGSVIDHVKTFDVTGDHLRFYIDGVESPDIVVNEGDKVQINFKSTEGYHDWRLDEFNAATDKVNPGETTSVEFTADKKGTFEYYCSVGKHRANGMRGNFIVN